MTTDNIEELDSALTGIAVDGEVKDDYRKEVYRILNELMSLARQDEAKRIFEKLEKAAEVADDNDDEDIVICKFGEACDEEACIYHKIKKECGVKL